MCFLHHQIEPFDGDYAYNWQEAYMNWKIPPYTDSLAMGQTVESLGKVN